MFVLTMCHPGYSSKLVFNLTEHPTLPGPPTVPGQDLNSESLNLEESALLTQLMSQMGFCPYFVLAYL